MALFLEESLYRGTQWVVFEPNDEPLWAQIRLNVGAFMQDVVPPGRLPGQLAAARRTSSSATRETTTQADINLGIVNILRRLRAAQALRVDAELSHLGSLLALKPGSRPAICWMLDDDELGRLQRSKAHVRC